MSAWLVVGLGNPGAEYSANRHNIGFMVVDELAKELRAGSFREKLGGLLTEASSSKDGRGAKLILLKPQQFMNVSGMAVQRAATFYKVGPTQTIVVHDEIDLPFERLRVKAGGGHGGHNGLRSVSENVGPDYLRVRCGVGKPGAVGDRDRVVGHVLSDFAKAERATLPIFIGEAASAVRAIVERGITYAMNQFNQERAKS